MAVADVFSPTVLDQQGLDGDFSVGIDVDVSDDFPSEFCWDGRGYDLEDVYVKMVRDLGYSDEELRCVFNGYSEYEHSNSDSVDCPVERVFKPMLDVGKYHVQRSYGHRNRSGDRALDRLDYLRDEALDDGVKMDYLIFLDLTVPKAVSERLVDGDREEIRDDFRSAVSEFFRRYHDVRFPDADSQFSPMRTVHIWSSKHPLEPHLHTHTVLPNITVSTERIVKEHPAGAGCPKIEEKKFSFHRFNPMLSEEDLEELREVWREVLEKYGFWSGGGLPDVYVETIKFRGAGRVASQQAKEDNARIHHKLSYMCRLPLEDLNENLGEGDLKEYDKDWADYLLNYTTVRANLGFGHNLKRLGYNSNKLTPVRCPICQGKMFYVAKHKSNLEEFTHLIRNNDGDWEIVEPPPNIEIDVSGVDGDDG